NTSTHRPSNTSRSGWTRRRSATTHRGGTATRDRSGPMRVDAVLRLSPTRPGDVGPDLHDGYEIHRAALCRGLDVMLYPRQVLTTRAPAGGAELSFAHGVPGTSTQSGVTFAQDRQMRREMQAAAGLPVPPGATFAVGREEWEAKRF